MFNLQAGQSGLPSLLLMGSVFLIMYFFFLRPQVKKQKAQDKFGTELSKGSEVVIGSGIIWRIHQIEGDVVYLQIDQKTFIKVLKGAISREMTESYNKKESGDSK